MKVLYCNPSFWDYRLPYYKKLNNLFGNFSVIYSTKRYQGREKLLGRIPTYLGNRAIPYANELMYDVSTRSFSKYTENGKQLPLPFGLIWKIWNYKPDVLRTEGFFQWTPWVLLYAFFMRVPVFMGYERTLWTERNVGKLKTLHRKITDLFVKGYLVNGSETCKYLESIGINSKKIFEVGMSADGIDLRNRVNEFKFKGEHNNKLSTKYSLFEGKYKKNGGLLYLFCGALIERKGIVPLLRAWIEHSKIYRNDTIVIVGGGYLYDKVMSEYGSTDSIFIEGRVEYENVHKYYAIADVFVLPTIEDNWSLVIPEAMSCGLPVATSIYNGCHPELVREGENGCTFDTFDNGSIVRALDYFHHVDLASFGKMSIEIEKDYNTEACAKREYEAVIKALKE